MTNGDGCHSCVYLRQPGTQRHARIQNTGGVTTTNKYLQADQWRWVPFLCVPVPTRDPMSRAVPEHWGCDHNSLVLSGEMGAILGRDQAVLATEGKVADHVQEDTSTHLDGEIKEEGANDVETVGEGPSNSEHQDSVDEGPSDGVDEGPSDGVDEGLSDGVDEGPSGGVNDSVNEGPCDGVDERPSDEGPSDGPSDESDSSSVDDTDLAAGAILVPDFKNNPDQDDIFATPWEKEHYNKYFPRQTRPSDSTLHLKEH
ncbi:hypothetical protein EMCRGX_G004366 [Ephydatia muelleri]